MAGKGKWSVQEVYRRCHGRYICARCKEGERVLPHGPYKVLRRRNPETGKQEAVYLGDLRIGARELRKINEKFDGPARPAKDEVISFL